jgi:DNA-binding GntR family transcriptional regulator
VALTELAPMERVGDAVYEAIREAIFSGAVGPGSKLSVPLLAQQLGVSRSPVREAVLRLTQERLAIEEPRRGAVVAEVTVEDLAGLYEVRSVLEGLAARLAVERASGSLVPELQALVDAHSQVVRLGDLAQHRELDVRFHRRIRQEAGNPELLSLLDGIQARVRLAMLVTSVTSGPIRAIEDHQAIIDAIESGDPERAERVARSHPMRMREALLRSESQPDDA